VFTNYVSGVEAGNLTDGFLTASGDNDTSDPPDGMDGTGPWMQQVGGGFSDGGSAGGGTRFPCTYRFSFWRSTRQLGINNPAPSTALTENVIELTVTAGAVRLPDGTVITPASGTVSLASVPLVSGGAGAVDPHTGEGSVSFALQCQNVETAFIIQARIRWNVQKRQHTLYGIVRECYEEGTPCSTVCSGSPPPDVLYLTIGNFSIRAGTFGGTYPSGTYVLERVPGFCASYRVLLDGCAGVGEFSVNWAVGGSVVLSQSITGTAGCGLFLFDAFDSSLYAPCGTGVIASGSREWGWYTGATQDNVPNAVGSLDWEVSA
jgi:hypothetical protein